MNKHKKLTLTTEEREHLESLIHQGQAPARTQTRARILLMSDYSQGNHWTDTKVAEALLCERKTVWNVRQRYHQAGLEAALYDKERPGGPPKITGEVEAHLIALACSQPPEGHASWTVRLLAEQLVALEVVESISHVAVWDKLKKTNLNLGE
jgi:hypothetical protein